MPDRFLYQAIRWLDLGDGIVVLQVLRIKSHLDQNRQGTYEEIWEDVPVVRGVANPLPTTLIETNKE